MEIEPLSLVLDNARVIDGSGAAPIEGGRVVIQGDRITSVGPADRVAVPADANRIDLTWTASQDNVGVHHYEITRSGVGVVGTSTTAQFSDTGLTPSTLYTYTVQAFDAAGLASPVSSPASATTLAGGGSSGIAFRAAATASTKGATTLTIARPTSSQAGDLLLASIDVRNAPAVTAPSGWTLVRTDATATIAKSTYRHVASAGEVSYSWTFTSAQTAAGVIAAYSGVDTSTPIDTSSGRTSSSGTAISAPSVDVAVAGSRLVSLVGVAGTATVSPPAGMTERAEIAGGTGSTKTVSEASDASVGAGATGDKTATASRAAPAVAQLIVLRPMP